MEFTDVRVPAGNLVGDEGGGMLYSREWFRFERLMVAARCTGAADRLVAEMTAFARTRVAGGVPIASHGLVAGMLADGVTSELFAGPLDAVRDRPRHRPRPVRREDRARPVLDDQALLLGDGQPGGRPRRPGVFGGPRLHAAENVAERFFRELRRVERIWEGTSEIQRMIIMRPAQPSAAPPQGGGGGGEGGAGGGRSKRARGGGESGGRGEARGGGEGEEQSGRASGV